MTILLGIIVIAVALFVIATLTALEKKWPGLYESFMAVTLFLAVAHIIGELIILMYGKG